VRRTTRRTSYLYLSGSSLAVEIGFRPGIQASTQIDGLQTGQMAPGFEPKYFSHRQMHDPGRAILTSELRP
jgi:hypothetical protein